MSDRTLDELLADIRARTIYDSLSMHITPSQERALEYLTIQILRHDSCGSPDRHEFKEWEVTQLRGSRTLHLSTVVGSKTDEGTMAQVFCRTRRHIAIGRRGGLHLLNGRKKNVRGARVTWALTD